MQVPSQYVVPANLSSNVLRAATEFDALENEWNDLLDVSEASVFQTFEWQRTWWEFFGQDRKSCQLFLVTMRENGKLRGIAPLYVEHIRLMGIFGFRRLSFIGREVSDYMDIIAERGYEGDVARGLVSVLASLKSEFDVVVLEDIPDRSLFHQQLYDLCLQESFAGDKFQVTQCPRTILKETWEETLASFTKKHRKDIAYELRNIHRHFAIEFELTSQASDVPRNMDDFVSMHQERWTHAGHPGVFRETVQADFHRAVAVKCFNRGWLFLSFLRLNGRRASVNYGFHFRDTVMTYLNGMIDSEQTSKFSPGKILHIYSMEESTRRNSTVYDFMRGRERYKYALGATDIPNWSIFLYQGSRSAPQRKLKAHLLVKSFQRRLRKEQLMFMHMVHENGWFSPTLVQHVLGRLRSNMSDSVRKIKEPEKNLDEP